MARDATTRLFAASHGSARHASLTHVACEQPHPAVAAPARLLPGIDAELAVQYGARGARLVLAARRKAELEAVRAAYRFGLTKWPVNSHVGCAGVVMEAARTGASPCRRQQTHCRCAPTKAHMNEHAHRRWRRRHARRAQRRCTW
jgi:hypothetical protein